MISPKVSLAGLGWSPSPEGGLENSGTYCGPSPWAFPVQPRPVQASKKGLKNLLGSPLCDHDSWKTEAWPRCSLKACYADQELQMSV